MNQLHVVQGKDKKKSRLYTNSIYMQFLQLKDI